MELKSEIRSRRIFEKMISKKTLLRNSSIEFKTSPVSTSINGQNHPK